MTIPTEVLKSLKVDVGSRLEIAVEGDTFVGKPRARSERRRYSLRELLRGATPQVMERLKEDTAWAREGGPVGREL